MELAESVFLSDCINRKLFSTLRLFYVENKRISADTLNTADFC